jgi:prophage maintenance system killer protein
MTEIIVFEDQAGILEVKLRKESVWLTQRQMSELLETSTDNIGLHLKNIYLEGELEEVSTTEEISVVRKEGMRKITRKIKHYNLDAILSVGYRVSSAKATRFRQWATRILHEYVTKGFALNNERLKENAQELQVALELVRKIANTSELLNDTGKGLVDIITRYTNTFLLLQKYDEGLLTEPRTNQGGVLPTLDEARKKLESLKADLIKRGQANNLFALERNDSFSALLGNLEQTVFGKPAYPSIESKAAHLLYFIIKNHPFTDGNKRSAAFMFIEFLNRNNHLLDDSGMPIINDTGLAALALLVAESDPSQKETMIRLIMNMLVKSEVH